MNFLKYYLFILLSFSYSSKLISQEVLIDFENDDLSGWGNTSDWIISATAPISGAKSLKHNLSGIDGESYINYNIQLSDFCGAISWQFQIKNGDWDPSGSNNFRFYVSANDSNLLSDSVDGYAVGINLGTFDDHVKLWEITDGTVSDTILAAGIDWNSSQTIGIKVTRTNSGDWELLIDGNGGFDGLASAGEINNTTYALGEYMGFYFEFSQTRAGLLWFDDLIVEEIQSFPDQGICLVTYDQASGKNKIIWQKTPNVGIDYYNIYKELVIDNYSYVGSVPVDSVSYFIDAFSNPDNSIAKYKLSAVDTCGLESSQSPHHKTMLLNITNGFPSGFNLLWGSYEGFQPDLYYILKGNSPDNMQVIDSVSYTITSYSDVAAPDCNLYYQVAAAKTISCLIDGQEYAMSFSNIVNTSITNPTDVVTTISDTGYCAGSNLALDAGNYYTNYLWSTGVTTQQLLVNAAGSYSVTVTDTNGCYDGYIDTILVEEYSLPVPAISITGNTDFCLGETAILDAGGPYSSYIWSDATTGQSIETDQSDNWTVTVTDENGCIGSSPEVTTHVQVPFDSQEFCCVSYDLVSEKNKLVWEKIENMGIVEYYIYKEISTDNFIPVGVIGQNDPSEFIDVASLPQSSSNRYKIAVMDTCGNMSAQSNYHKSVLLELTTLTPGYQLIWNHYEGMNFSQYYIYRGNSPENLQLFDSVTAMLGYYVDMSALECELYYQVAAVRDLSCTVDGQAVTMARSNIAFNGITNPVIQTSLSDTGYCAGNILILDASSIYSNYAWSTGETSQTITISTPGYYAVTATDNSGCYDGYSDSAYVTEHPLPQPTIIPSGTPAICQGENLELDAGAGYIGYAWNNGLSQQTIQVDSTFTYEVIITDTNQCSNSSAPYYVFVQKAYEGQELCLVTVEPMAGKNKVMWEKAVDLGTETYYIHKELSTNVYGIIGVVDHDSLSYFIDYSSQPESHGDKYKITLIDSCGNVSEYSGYHKTMNLGLSNFGATMYLDWDDYQVETGDFVPDYYYIYRGPSPYDLTLIDSISASFTSYNDVGVYDVYFYMIGVAKNTPCVLTSVNKAIEEVQYAFSNKKDNEDLITAILEQNPDFGKIRIYPNPFSDQTTIEFDNSSQEYNYLILMDITGKELRKYDDLEDGKVIIERNGLSRGMYYVRLVGKSTINIKTVIN